MKNKTGIAVIIIILAVIILCGLISWRQNERNGGSEEQGYAQEQNVDSSGDETSDGISSEPFSIETSEDSEEYQDTEPEAEELPGEEQIRAWYDEWFNMDTYIWYSNSKEFRQKALTYQLAEPCHFILLPECTHANDTYKYRNIDDSSLYNEYGERIYMQEAYLADVIVDKYIREYGGKEGLYSIRDTSESLGDSWETGLFEVYTFEISNEDTTLRVLYTLRDSLVSVYIEGAELEEITEFEKMTYLYWSNMYDYRYRYDEYWLLLDPEFQQREYCHRNVEQNLEVAGDSELKCDERAYYIADQAIDQYIRDYGGNDSLYNVELTEKEADAENGGYKYVLFVENLEDSEQKMQIEYSDTDWLVVVKVPDGEERMLKYWLGEEAYQSLYGETE